MSPITRRSFLKTGMAAGAMATIGTIPLVAARRTATDTVVLGPHKVEVTRLAFGTGTDGGAVQAALGQQEFTRLVHYAVPITASASSRRRRLTRPRQCWARH